MDHRTLRLDILRYISLSLSTSDADAMESGMVAVQCLLSAWGLEERDVEEREGHPTLMERVNGGGEKAYSPQDRSEDPAWLTFFNGLVAQNYFANCPQGTPVFQQRETEAWNLFSSRRADEFKVKGNDLLKQKKYEAAINCYTSAIELLPKEPIYYSNRAAAKMALEDYDSAIEDCLEAVAINSGFVKGLMRLGTCYYYKGQFAEAVEAYEKVLNLEPTNEDARENLQRAKAEMQNGGGESSGSQQEMPFQNLFGGNMGNLAGMLNQPGMANLVNQMAQAFAPPGAQGSYPSEEPSSDNDNDNDMDNGEGEGEGERERERNADSDDPLYTTDSQSQQQDDTELEDDSANDSAESGLDPRLREAAEDLRSGGLGAAMRHMNNPEVMGAVGDMINQMGGMQNILSAFGGMMGGAGGFPGQGQGQGQGGNQ